MTICERMVAGRTKNRISTRAKRQLASDRYYSDNRERLNAMMRAYKKNTIQRRGYLLKKKYGLTQADYSALLEAQKGVCAICGLDASKNRYGKLFVDHCHDTGRVRGLLCNACNRKLGLFTIRQLEAAIAYLKG